MNNNTLRYTDPSGHNLSCDGGLICHDSTHIIGPEKNEPVALPNPALNNGYPAQYAPYFYNPDASYNGYVTTTIIVIEEQELEQIHEEIPAQANAGQLAQTTYSAARGVYVAAHTIKPFSPILGDSTVVISVYYSDYSQPNTFGYVPVIAKPSGTQITGIIITNNAEHYIILKSVRIIMNNESSNISLSNGFDLNAVEPGTSKVIPIESVINSQSYITEVHTTFFYDGQIYLPSSTINYRFGACLPR